MKYRYWLFRRMRNSGHVLQVVVRTTGLSQHMPHVKTPAVHTPRRFQPVANDTVFAAINFIHQAFRGKVQLGQAGIPQPVERNAVG